MSQEAITIVIDGVEVKAQPGQTIMQAAEAAGIYIPHLCYHKDLPPGGHCRVCTVKVNGKPASSCTHPVSDGMVIENDTEELKTKRREIIEMLFAGGNHFCPFCEASGDCELQALGYRLGMMAATYQHLYPKHTVDASHKDLFIDRDRCVLCGRCVRASETKDGKHVFGFEGRGINKEVSVDAPDDLSETDMVATDKAATICPVGSLKLKRVGYKTPYGERTYDKAPIGSDVEKKQTV